jgi:hypothetical protein
LVRIALAETILPKRNRAGGTHFSAAQQSRRLGALAALVAALTWASGTARALPEAAFDSADRFPFVVEVKFQDQLICSGTVLYPRIVVTAAHCLQQKVYWRGSSFYVDDYVAPSDLQISLVRDGTAVGYDVVDVSVSPDWLDVTSTATPSERFAHDVAVVVTKQPVDVDLPPDLPLGKTFDVENAPSRSGLLVAFGVGSCAPFGPCGQAGIRRYRVVTIERDADCGALLGNSHYKPNAGGTDVALASAVWCLDASVMPGDSGGALFVEGGEGQLYFCGVISAQRGPPEIAALSSFKKSVATMLSANQGFIAGEARRLGYTP